MFVDVPIKVTELARIVAKANGNNILEALTRARRAIPVTIGTKKAVAAVLLIKELRLAAVTIISTNMRSGLVPVSF
jgi:hypothetical protein